MSILPRSTRLRVSQPTNRGDLALVTVLQYAEGLTDRQAANAVRERIDWKYALGLELTDAGFDFSVFSEFRTAFGRESGKRRCCWIGSWRSAKSAAGSKLVASNAPIRRMCWHVSVRSPTWNAWEKRCVRSWMICAALAPDWLVQQITLDWFERYSHRVENYRLPKAESQRTALAQQIGADGLHLLQALEKPDAPADAQERGQCSAAAPGLAAVL